MINQKRNPINNTRRRISKAVAWSVPAISAVSLPSHAQATSPIETACEYPAVSTFNVTSITTDDSRSFVTPTPATWEPNPNFAGENVAVITISGTDVTVDISAAFVRTFPAAAFSIRGRNICTGTIDLDSGMVTITDIGPRMPMIGGAADTPHYYSPSAAFSFQFPCGATNISVTYAAENDFITELINEYTWELQS